ncbi:hypothetical protein EB354_07930 [Chryseobacterium balustinum]|nr:hypothetical protein EB354_07930 [Chryseobacterium balustinum]
MQKAFPLERLFYEKCKPNKYRIIKNSCNFISVTENRNYDFTNKCIFVYKLITMKTKITRSRTPSDESVFLTLSKLPQNEQ